MVSNITHLSVVVASLVLAFGASAFGPPMQRNNLSSIINVKQQRCFFERQRGRAIPRKQRKSALSDSGSTRTSTARTSSSSDETKSCKKEYVQDHHHRASSSTTMTNLGAPKAKKERKARTIVTKLLCLTKTMGHSHQLNHPWTHHCLCRPLPHLASPTTTTAAAKVESTTGEDSCSVHVAGPTEMFGNRAFHKRLIQVYYQV